MSVVISKNFENIVNLLILIRLRKRKKIIQFEKLAKNQIFIVIHDHPPQYFKFLI